MIPVSSRETISSSPYRQCQLRSSVCQPWLSSHAAAYCSPGSPTCRAHSVPSCSRRAMESKLFRALRCVRNVMCCVAVHDSSPAERTGAKQGRTANVDRGCGFGRVWDSWWITCRYPHCSKASGHGAPETAYGWNVQRRTRRVNSSRFSSKLTPRSVWFGWNCVLSMAWRTNSPAICADSARGLPSPPA